MRLHGRTALIAGAARNIGFGIAQRFAAEGARVAVVDRDARALTATPNPPLLHPVPKTRPRRDQHARRHGLKQRNAFGIRTDVRPRCSTPVVAN
jgi:NAD(P)-dependent dehydrogenase (short-subunit alcohol dehydrogenase family)